MDHTFTYYHYYQGFVILEIVEVSNDLFIHVQKLFYACYRGIMHNMLRQLNVNGEEAL